jgi:hypothetical protein
MEMTGLQWTIVVLGLIAPFGPVFIDWALWHFIWTPFSERLRCRYCRMLKANDAWCDVCGLSVRRRTPGVHDTPPEGAAGRGHAHEARGAVAGAVR